MAATIILVRDKNNPDLMELAEFSDGHEAEKYVEDLLANGVPQDVIRAFSAVELHLQVSHRPVVSLGDESTGAAPQQAEPVAATAESRVESDAPAQDGPATAGQPQEGAQPFTRDGVRFSSLFRSDSNFEPV